MTAWPVMTYLTHPSVRRFLRATAGALLLASLCLWTGCDTQGAQDEFARRAGLPPSGYTEISQDGTLVSEDPDDWRTAPVYQGVVRIDPARPNPVEGAFISIPVTVYPGSRMPGRLELRAYDSAGRLRLGLDEILGAGSPGAYAFNFASGLFPQRGLQRVFVFDGFGELVSYGDIFIK